MLDTAGARQEAARILQQVAQARELEVKSEVDVLVASKDDIRTYARENMYEYITPQELAQQGRIEAAWGVIPVNSDVEQILLDMLENGVAGFYDPKKKTLFIGDFVSSSMLSQVVGHEIAHGLQDMHFGLEDRMEPMRHRSDAEEAQRFLIEGGAQAAYLAWVSGEDGLQAIDDAVLDAMVDQTLEIAGSVAPHPILARSLHLPYTAGTAVVIRVVLQQGWKGVDALYAELPQTTEQMLHVDKLQAREPARPVHVDHDAVAAALKQTVVWHDQVGEAALLAMLADVEPASIAKSAAAGWGGDAMLALETDGASSTTVVAAIAWDSRRDAEEFEVSVRKYADARAPGRSLISRRRDVVLLATGLPTDADPDALEPTLWKAVRVEKSRVAKGAR